MGGFEDRRHPFGKGKKKKEEKRVQEAPGLSQAEKVKANQASVEYFYCKKRGHWKRNYPLDQVPLDLNRPRKGKQ